METAVFKRSERQADEGGLNRQEKGVQVTSQIQEEAGLCAANHMGAN